MSWRVQVSGDVLALSELAKVETPECAVRQIGAAFVLESVHFAECTSPEQVRAEAKTLAEWLSGAAALIVGRPAEISIGAIEGPPTATGGRSLYITGEVSVRSDATAIPTITRTLPDGTVEQMHLAAPVPNWLTVARHVPQAADVLRQWGSNVRDWNALYQIREKVAAAVGGDGAIRARQWTTSAELTRFDRTANSHAVLGDAARHGVQRQEPPPNPMTLHEAQRFIERVIRKWLGQLAAEARD